MVRMSLKVRMEYQKVLRERYWKARGRREKSQILDEYCSNTGQSRKYATRRQCVIRAARAPAEEACCDKRSR